jgi:excinuclease ABC subunit C
MKSQGLKKLKLPDAPGVYFWKDGKGKTLYIGRATSLRSRVRSYFGNDVISTRGSRIVDMVTRSKTVMFEKTDSVLEAIILEANLIKKFQPKYNTDEKDDKSWNYIVITDEEWPRIIIERGRTLEKLNKGEVPDTSFVRPPGEPSGRVLGMGNRGMAGRKNVSGAETGGKLFGPYPAGGLLKDALKIIRRIFPYLDEKSIDPKHRSFYASIGLSPMLGGKTSRKEYLKTIKNIHLFLEGKKKVIIKGLKKEMMVYAKNQEFEKSDKAKRTIYALEHIEDVALIKSDTRNGSSGYDAGGFRIEAYDIAHLSGKNVVGVMTVVEGGEPNKNEYRKFKISHEKNDDAAALREILLRRLGHPEWPYPSLIVVDGGQIQLNVAQKVLSELKSDIMVVALVKDDRHKARGIIADESLTTNNPALLSQYKRAIILANSEAHRFAISYHKNLRKRNFLQILPL